MGSRSWETRRAARGTLHASKGRISPWKERTALAWQRVETARIRRWRNTLRPADCSHRVNNTALSTRSGKEVADVGWCLRAALHHSCSRPSTRRATPAVGLRVARSAACAGRCARSAHHARRSRHALARSGEVSRSGRQPRVADGSVFGDGGSSARGNPASVDRVAKRPVPTVRCPLARGKLRDDSATRGEDSGGNARSRPPLTRKRAATRTG